MEAPATRLALRRSRTRSVAVYVVLVFASLLLLLTSFAVWIDRVALNTEVFADTSTELIEDDAIREAVATRAVDELFGSVDVEAELRGQLPDNLKRLSGPARAGLREAAYLILNRALEQPQLQRVWSRTLEESHQTLVNVLEGDTGRVPTEEGVVTLDLETIVLEAADRIGLRQQVADNLPEDVGRIEILRSDELDTAQDAFNVLNTLAWVLPVLTLAAFALVVFLAGDRRRRIVREIGFSVLAVGILGLLAVNLVGNYLVGSLVAETETKIAADDAWDIVTDLLRQSFRSLALIGIVFVVASWLAGPGRRAVTVRRALAPAVRERVWAYTGLLVIALILLLTGAVADFARTLVVLLLLALGVVWIEVMRAQTGREWPDVTASTVIAELRDRVKSWVDARRLQAPRRAAAPTAPDSAGDLAARLSVLADLHARGELTDEEFAAAKARVLAGE